jgi:hypothetical protein
MKGDAVDLIDDYDNIVPPYDENDEFAENGLSKVDGDKKNRDQ